MVKMTEEPEDYEGPWPKESTMDIIDQLQFEFRENNPSSIPYAIDEITKLRAEVEALKEGHLKQAQSLMDEIQANNCAIDSLNSEVEALRADAEKKDALLVRAHDMLGYIGGSPEGASNDIRMAEELQRDIDAARAAQGGEG